MDFGLVLILVSLVAFVKGQPTNSSKLIPGIVQQGTVANGEKDNFYVEVGNNTLELTILCTPLADGDPDLYASFQANPDSLTANYSARSIGEDAITIPWEDYQGKPYVYVAVFGWRTSTYTMLASFESRVGLVEGIPQSGQVPREGTDYFEVHVAQGQGEMTISATPIRGDIRLFISNSTDPEHDKPSTWNWASTPNYQGEAIVIRPTDPSWPTTGTFYIGVYGVSNASYSIVAATNVTAITLRDGVPQNDNCDTNQTEYFLINLNNPGCNLTVTVTPISGDPDLYMSTTEHYPNRGKAEWQSLAYGADKISISPAQATTYYIGVYAWRSTTFTILGEVKCENKTSASVLVNGSPQQGILNTGDEQLYRVHIQPGNQDANTDLTISLTRRYGDPDLYVTNNGTKPTPSNYQWKSNFYGDDVLTISSSDPSYCTNCDYLIGVYSATNCSYTITTTDSTHYVRLQEGVPITNPLVKGQSEYFRYDVQALTKDITFTVTSLGLGDPDLFISVNTTHPNNTNSDWAAQRLYGDSITIPHTDPKACQFCTYWIAVYSFTNATFTIVASLNSPIRLQDGIPQSGHVLREQFIYYDFQSNGVDTVNFVLTTLNGSNSLYITAGDVYPETGLYDWYVAFFNTVKTQSIAPTDPKACHNSSCYYRIGAYGIEDSDYTIVVQTARSIVLQNGVSQRFDVGVGGWEYFQIKVEAPNKDLTIIATAITGDPDLYVSTTIQRPNSTEGFYDKKASRYGTDAIDYENATIGTYYIGVNAFATNSTFSINALITDSIVPCFDLICSIQLLEGQPQQGTVHQGQYAYYYFHVPSGEGAVTFSLSKSYGDPDLYISIYNGSGSFPNQTSKTWASTSVQNDVVSLSNPVGGTYVVGVYAYQTSGYTLTAMTNSSVVTLQNGVPFRGVGYARGYNYYVMDVDSTEDFTVTVTPFSGDPDIYISRYPNVSKDNFTWGAAQYRDDSVTIPSDDPGYCQCTFYIAIYSFSDSTYTVVASLSPAQTLESGVPQTGRVEVEAWRYYILQTRSQHAWVTISLSPKDGNPDLYVNLGTKPELNNATWSVVNSDFTTSILTIRPGDPHFCSDPLCVYYIGVRGQTASNFTIVAQIGGGETNFSSTKLQNAVPVRDWVDTGTYKYYSFDVSTPNQDVTIIVTPLTGDPDLYVSTVNTQPTQTVGTYNYSSRAVGADAVAVTNSSAPLTYYIGVFAFQNSTYTVTAYVECDSCNPISLVNGIPQNGVVNSGVYQYYRVFVTNLTAKLSISVTRTVGDPDLYVRNDGQIPSKTSSQWNSTSFGQDLIQIMNPTPGEYDISVYGYATSQYQILVSTLGCTTLANGVPVREGLIQGHYEYFCFNVDRSDDDLTVSVTSFNGDPDLYISSTNANPNISNAEWAARSPREDTITIPATELRFQTYYISVQAWTNCTFTITASLSGEVILVDGTPQTGSVHYEESIYYRFRVASNVTEVTVTLTPFVGNGFLYMSNGTAPDRSKNLYRWQSVAPTTGQEIKIFPSDPYFCTDCLYYIEVYGYSDSNYTIVARATSNTTTVTLQDSVPFRTSIGTGEYIYFGFDLILAQAALAISVTPISGDPDLYVVTGDGFPTTQNYTWRGVAYGADTVNIDFTDPNFKVGRYSIGVYAWRNSTFSILVTMIPIATSSCVDTPINRCPAIVLQNGVPQVSFLNATGNAIMYEFYVGSKEQQTVSFSVTPRYGDPDIYIRNDGQTPNSTYYQYAARSYGRDSVDIDDGCLNCRYLVRVEAYTHTLYSIVATIHGHITVLENGVPIQRNLDEHQTQYFYVIVGDSLNALIVSATAISGDPDLFISNTTQYPNASNAEWRVQAYGSDQFVLNNPPIGTYYIAAYAYHNASFTLVATNGPITLVNGEPHSDQLDRGQYRQYQVIVNDLNHSEFTISLNVNDGDPVMYVGINPNLRPDPTDNTTYLWSTAVAATTAQRYIITIAPNSVGACYNCTYFIRVVANSSLSTFAITATYGSQAIVLQSNTPYSSTVRQGEYVYFRGRVDSSRDINIGVTTFTGDTDLVVSPSNPHPNKDDSTSYTWKSPHDPTARGDYVYIPSAGIGYYYIGVYGWQDSKFTITLSTNATLLPAGTAQVGIISQDGSAFFFLDVTTKTDVRISLSAFNSSQNPESYRVYVTTNSSVPQPDANKYYWYQSLAEGDSMFISRNDPNACASCTYYIGVYGTVERSFALLASTETTADTLFNGKPFQGSVSNEGLKYFQMFVPKADDFTVFVEVCTGDVNLYMAQDTYKPSPDEFKFSSANTDENEMIPVRDKTILQSEFYIGVYGSGEGVSDFIITAWTATPPETAPNVGTGIILTKPHSDNVELSFPVATSLNYSSNLLKYTVYYTTNEQPIVMYSLCGIKKASSLPSFNFTKAASQQGIIVTVKNLLRDRTYKFNVVVEDPAGSYSLYTATSATTEDMPPSNLPIAWILGIGIPAGIIIVLFIVYLIVRNRKLTKELEIEMHDIPKHAVRKAVAGPPSTRVKDQRQPYNRLLQTDDDEETGDYAGPDAPISAAT